MGDLILGIILLVHGFCCFKLFLIVDNGLISLLVVVVRWCLQYSSYTSRRHMISIYLCAGLNPDRSLSPILSLPASTGDQLPTSLPAGDAGYQSTW